jgi:hypothetical protein
MLGAFVRTYPGRSTLALVGVFIASLFEGLGMSMLLSMLSVMSGEGNAVPSTPQRIAMNVVGSMGLVPTALNLLYVAVGLIAMRGVMRVRTTCEYFLKRFRRRPAGDEIHTPRRLSVSRKSGRCQ